MARMKGGELIAEYLVKQKVPSIFGICGHGSVGILDPLHALRDRITLVSPRHEQCAVPGDLQAQRVGFPGGGAPGGQARLPAHARGHAAARAAPGLRHHGHRPGASEADVAAAVNLLADAMRPEYVVDALQKVLPEDAEVRPPSTGTWQLPPTPYKEPAFGKPWVA